jgi:hypothetical protein
MKTKRIAFLFALVVGLFWLSSVHAAMPVSLPAGMPLEQFSIKPFSANDFYVFVKVFSEMRGPLRAEILKDRKTNFENADPLKYVEKVKDKRDVRNMLKDNDLTWDQFVELWGNVMLGYFSVQPNKTKAALIRQIADYGLVLKADEIPAEYRDLVNEVIKTEAGSTLAAAALEYVVQIPPQNVSIVKENQKQLDRMFYTKYWIDELK